MPLDLTQVRKRNPESKTRLDMLTVRVQPELHQRLKSACQEENVSLNGLCVALIEHWLAGRAQPPAVEQDGSEQAESAEAA